MRIFLFVWILGVAIGQARAEDVAPIGYNNRGSEFFFQVDEGFNEVQLQGEISGFVAPQGRWNGQPTTVTRTSWEILGLTYAHAMSDMVAVGFHAVFEEQVESATLSQQSYGQSYNQSYSNSRGGLEDPAIFVDGRVPLNDWGSLRFGASLALALEASEFNASNDGNLASGGDFAFSPYVGFDKSLGRGLSFLLKLEAALRTSRTQHYPTEDLHYSDGNSYTISAGYEWIWKQIVAGGYLDWSYVEPTIVSSSARTGTWNDGNDYPFDATAYARFNLSKSFALVPQLSALLSEGNIGGAQYTGWSTSLHMRFTF